jgi:ribosomal 30S subunit maturation factor RimM
VKAGADEFLVPFAEAICTAIDVKQKKIQVKLPEGLRELNRGSS